MAGKYKATGCARFFLFLVIIVPIAYYGANYLFNSGKLDELKERFETTSSDSSLDEETYEPTNSTNPNISKLERKMEQLIETVKEQQITIKNQEKAINSQQDIIEQLKAQLTTQGGVTTPTTTTTVPPAKPAGEGQSLEELLKEADKALQKNKN